MAGLSSAARSSNLYECGEEKTEVISKWISKLAGIAGTGLASGNTRLSREGFCFWEDGIVNSGRVTNTLPVEEWEVCGW